MLKQGKCFNKFCKAVGSQGKFIENYKENGYGAWFCFKCVPKALSETRTRRLKSVKLKFK